MKALIEKNFNKAANTYENSAVIQKRAASHLTKIILDCNTEYNAPQKILDIGCGTGFMVESLYQNFPSSNFIINDIAYDMLMAAKKKFQYIPNLEINPGDAENISFTEVDLITSNLAFQWFRNLPSSIGKLYKNTKVIAFSTLVDGSFSEWERICKKFCLSSGFHRYPTFNELRNLCLELSPRFSTFEMKSYEVNFANAKEFVYYLREIGANTPRLMNRLPYGLKQIIQDGQSIKANYEVFFAVLAK